MNEAFIAQMKEILKEEYPAYVASLSTNPVRGFRVNLLKTSAEELQKELPFEMKPTRYCSNGYLLPDDYVLKNSNAYLAGLFYVQEPSASAAVTILDPKPGMNILDLCAAPGSKSTEIAERMNHQGILVCNEIHPKRVKILAENIEHNGAANVNVINADPSDVALAFPEFFDAVLCDAPCSGEGMFRKNDDAMQQWSPNGVLSCALRQRKILEEAYACLKPGGTLVYSTCTFNLEENEHTVEAFLDQHPDMEVVSANVNFGRPGLTERCKEAIRLFPMDEGEGHFICRLQKANREGYTRSNPSLLKSDAIPSFVTSFLKDELLQAYPYMYLHKDRLYVSSVPFLSSGNCRLIRQGIPAGEIRNQRFEPDHGLGVSAYTTFQKQVEISDEDVLRYRRGESLTIPCKKGYTAVMWHSHPIGFAKSDGQILKNKYPKEYRTR